MSDGFEKMFYEHLKDDKAFQEKILAELSEIKGTFKLHAGFVGGIVFLVSAIATVIGLAIAWFK